MLSPNAQKIFEMKYAVTLPSGKKESWERMAGRVGSYVASAETRESNRLQYTADFTKLLLNKTFIPGGRILANAGTGIKNMFNCFVLPVDDSRQGIYETLKNAAEIFAWGGGIGFNFSDLREEGSTVKTTGGKASGPVSFMELFNTTGSVISQASRRGAQMGILNVDHPDIVKFIRQKYRLNTENAGIFADMQRYITNDKDLSYIRRVLADNQLIHFNISVGITDDFMESLVHQPSYMWELISRVGEEPTFIEPDDLYSIIAENAWGNGDPGLFFLDTAEKYNPVKYLGKIESTNPCVTGDTKILTVYGGTKTIKQLVDEKKDVLVYSWDTTTHKFAIKTMRNPRLTRKNTKVIEVEFDNGNKLKCTPDHNLFTFRGDKIKARDLAVGQSIRAFSMSKHRDGQLRIHNWINNKTAHQWIHHLVYEYFHGEIPEDKVINHKDKNPENNDISNLEIMSVYEHNSFHYKDRLSGGFFYNQTKEQAMLKYCNHKVIAIRDAGYEDVYNGTVDDFHTYVIVDENTKAGMLSGIISANCGEVPLLPYESCCLGSINLAEFVDDDFVDTNYLIDVVKYAVRFLDNVHTLNETPVEEVNTASKLTRRLGLGVMGFADVLAEMKVPYDSDDAIAIGEYLAKTIQVAGWEASMELADERGPFDAFDYQMLDWRIIDSLNLPRRPLRNVAVTSIAPTGTISILAGVNSGIEPFFSKSYIRNVTLGESNAVKDSMKVNIDYDSVKTAHEINWKSHIDVQAIWQKYTDNAVSKTINMDESCTVQDVMDAFTYAYKMGCKGTTIYRNNSKIMQVLNTI